MRINDMPLPRYQYAMITTALIAAAVYENRLPKMARAKRNVAIYPGKSFGIAIELVGKERRDRGSAAPIFTARNGGHSADS